MSPLSPKGTSHPTPKTSLLASTRKTTTLPTRTPVLRPPLGRRRQSEPQTASTFHTTPHPPLLVHGPNPSLAAQPAVWQTSSPMDSVAMARTARSTSATCASPIVTALPARSTTEDSVNSMRHQVERSIQNKLWIESNKLRIQFGKSTARRPRYDAAAGLPA